VVHWLDTAIVGGTVPSGSVAIHGKTSDFPFDKGGGVFDIRFHLVHGELDYADGWPAVKDLDADVRFLDQGLEAHANSGTIAGDGISDATARFADLSTGVLTVDGDAGGDASNALLFLRSPPLRHYLGGYLDGLEAAGPANTSLHLVLPVEDLSKFELHGVANLHDVSFAPKGVPAAALDHLQRSIAGFAALGLSDSRPALDERTAVAMEEILGGRCNPGNPTGPGGGRPADAIDAANDFHADVRYLRAVPDLYPDKSEVEPEHLDAWRLFTEVGTLTIRELLGYNLPGLGSRESCTKMLNLFKNHKGATSQRDPNDGRSERFFCTAQPKRRSREA